MALNAARVFTAISFAAALFLLPGFAAVAQSGVSAAQKTEIQKIIKEYLLKNPEVVREALIELERRTREKERNDRAKAVAALAPKLLRSKHQVVVGNPKGTINLVEFFDYNCGYCRRAMRDLNQLISKNPDLRVVLKEFPVLGPPSREAAIIAMALNMQVDSKTYWKFHNLLMNARGRAGKAAALAAAKAVGADMKRLAEDMKSSKIAEGLREVTAIANTLNLTGTPSYVVGPDVVVGAVGYVKLQTRISNLRKCGKATCS